MSGALVFLAWSSTITDSTKLAVLDKLCNFAGDDGENCFPGTKLLAGLARRTERTVIRAIHDLEAEGWIAIEKRGNGARNKTHYIINVEKLKECQDVTLQVGNRRAGKGDNGVAKRVTFTTRKGDIGDNPPHPLFGVTSRNQVQEPPTPQPPASGGRVCDGVQPAATKGDEVQHDATELDEQQRRHLDGLADRGQREFWERHYREDNERQALAKAKAAEAERARAAERERLRAQIPDVAGAVNWVMRKFSVPASKRRWPGRFLAVIELEAELGRSPWETAPAMVAAWEEYGRASPGLRAPFGMMNFFETGVWKDKRRWHRARA